MALNFPLSQLGSRLSFNAVAGFLARAQNRYYAKHFAQPRFVRRAVRLLHCAAPPSIATFRRAAPHAFDVNLTAPPPSIARFPSCSIMPLFHGACLTFLVGYSHHYQHLSA